MSLTIQLDLEVDLQRRRRYKRTETFFHYLLSRLLNSPQKASHRPLLLSQTACFHVLQPCWKTEKELTHEGSSRNSDPQSTTTKHSLTLKGESADLFLLALRSLFFKLKPICDPGQRTCHTWRPNLWKYGSACSGRCSDHSLPGPPCNNSSFYCSLSRQVAWGNVTLNYRSIELNPPRFCWDFKSGKRQAACKINSQLLVCDWTDWIGIMWTAALKNLSRGRSSITVPPPCTASLMEMIPIHRKRRILTLARESPGEAAVSPESVFQPPHKESRNFSSFLTPSPPPWTFSTSCDPHLFPS